VVQYIVSGKDTRPSDAAQAVVWCDKAAAAAGAIYRVLEPGHNHRLPRAGAADNAAYHAHASPLSSSTQDTVCDFCGFKDHLEATCHCRAAARDQACKDIANRKARRHSGCSQVTDAASAASVSLDSVQSTRKAYSIELAGNASTSSSPEPLSAILAISSTDWTANTGATAHMTPHHH
jgi:hypothetical protein